MPLLRHGNFFGFGWSCGRTRQALLRQQRQPTLEPYLHLCGTTQATSLLDGVAKFHDVGLMVMAATAGRAGLSLQRLNWDAAVMLWQCGCLSWRGYAGALVLGLGSLTGLVYAQVWWLRRAWSIPTNETAAGDVQRLKRLLCRAHAALPRSLRRHSTTFALPLL